MGNGWLSDKAKADKYEPEIKRILGEQLISTADLRRDQHEATDLLVLELSPVRIGCRVRSPEVLVKFADEFTIRADRPSGVRTELEKIMDGWCDYFFYGFAAGNGRTLAAWLLGDLRVFRAEIRRAPYLVDESLKIQNRDASSSFFPFGVGQFPPQFIIGRKRAEARAEGQG